MTKVDNNVLLFGAHGMFGKQVVMRIVNGKIIISKPPDFSKTKWSEKQKEHRDRFKSACKRARFISADPVRRARYEKKRKPGQTIFNVVLKELLAGPEDEME
ncbi:MAG: hypothetical protein WCK34_15130, partial [Bacteroidota bacterium]